MKLVIGYLGYAMLQLRYDEKWHFCNSIEYSRHHSYMIVDCSDSCVLLLMREIIEQITARSPMVGTQLL